MTSPLAAPIRRPIRSARDVEHKRIRDIADYLHERCRMAYGHVRTVKSPYTLRRVFEFYSAATALQFTHDITQTDTDIVLRSPKKDEPSVWTVTVTIHRKEPTGINIDAKT